MMDNFTVEIFLNKPIQVGCIQLKLKFSKELVTPLEVRLYKQKKTFDTEKSSKSLDLDHILFVNSDSLYKFVFRPTLESSS